MMFDMGCDVGGVSRPRNVRCVPWLGEEHGGGIDHRRDAADDLAFGLGDAVLARTILVAGGAGGANFLLRALGLLGTLLAKLAGLGLYPVEMHIDTQTDIASDTLWLGTADGGSPAPEQRDALCAALDAVSL